MAEDAWVSQFGIKEEKQQCHCSVHLASLFLLSNFSPANTWKLHKVAYREIQTGCEQKVTTVTVVKYQNRLPSKVVVASDTIVFKKHLDNALNSIF